MSGLGMGWRSIRTGAAKRRAAAEALERRVLLSGTLSGTAWDDVDGDGVRDEGEAHPRRRRRSRGASGCLRVCTMAVDRKHWGDTLST